MSHKFWRMINKILFSEYSFFVYFFPNLRNSSVLSCYWCLVQFNARTEGELLDFSKKMIRDKHMQNVCDKITSFAEYSKITGRNGMFSNFLSSSFSRWRKFVLWPLDSDSCDWKKKAWIVGRGWWRLRVKGAKFMINFCVLSESRATD